MVGKKRSKKQSPSRKQPVGPRQGEAATLLQQAARHLRRRQYEQVIRAANGALKAAQLDGERESARQLLAEVYFRLAMQAAPAQRLGYLKEALKWAPQDARLHFHRALALWRTGTVEEAQTVLESVARHDPARPALPYLRQLARLGSGQPWQAEGLSEAEVNTLRVVERLLKGGRDRASLPEPLLGPAALWQALLAMQQEEGTPQEALATLAAQQRGPVAGLLHYYEGVAALRAAKAEQARAAWAKIDAASTTLPAAYAENRAYLLREEAVALAEQGKWQQISQLAQKTPDFLEDRIFSETVGLAYFHLGYEAAQAGQWPQAAVHWRRAEKHISSRHLAQNLALAEEELENWRAAAEAWRSMVRRRPRKESHPDYLDDAQVAALWQHAASCYKQVPNDPEALNEAVTCLKTALQYAPQDTSIRLALASALLANRQPEAAFNELQRLLDIDPTHVGALTYLASIELEYGRAAESIPLWRKVLEIDPAHREAREGLAQAYQERFAHNWFMSEKERLETLQAGLKDLPEHPKLLILLGRHYLNSGHPEAARDHFQRAYRAAPQEIEVVAETMHELLHVGGEAVVEEMIPTIHQHFPALPPLFWITQAEQIIECELDEGWARRFYDEALYLAEQPSARDSKALVLVQICFGLGPAAPATLRQHYEARIRQEVPNSGAVEFVEALHALEADAPPSKVERLFNGAKKKARRAKEEGMIDFIEEVKLSLTIPAAGSPGFLEWLMDQFAGEHMEDFPDDLF